MPAIRAPHRLAAGSAERAASSGRPPLVIGCGALARELVALTRRAGFPEVDLTCLPADLHNRPERIPAAVQARIRRARAQGYDRIFVAYADCGTGGMLDRMLESEGVARLEGAHCYEVYAGRAAFAALAEEEPGTFYLTDFLARNFERLVVRGLGLDRHPELLPLYFGNYRRLVFLAQTDDAGLTRVAHAAARRLDLAFERRFVGLGEMAPSIALFAASTPRAKDASPFLIVDILPEGQLPAPSGIQPAASASDAPKRRAATRRDPETVAIRRQMQDLARSTTNLVTKRRRMQPRDDLLREAVTKVHRMQEEVPDLRWMRRRDQANAVTATHERERGTELRSMQDRSAASAPSVVAA